ncbi:MAG: MogA/MoaB family molybdenum cofactor biosynthesis protein [Deltaproteobacteria bacterium]|nr:MogA/MoaB family molybdenum cofactor biosynthesis protein [Deltaproteobacteria bacterium]
MAHHRTNDARRVGCVVITVSDTRGSDDDRSGAVIEAALTGAGHAVVDAQIVPDERGAIRAAVLAATDRSDVRAVIVTGGTGIALRDVTIESLADAWAKELPGFGEIFRALSFEEIGAAAFLSRAAAGVIGHAFVALLPGSPAACELALRRLLLPELGHVAGLLSGSARP